VNRRFWHIIPSQPAVFFLPLRYCCTLLFTDSFSIKFLNYFTFFLFNVSLSIYAYHLMVFLILIPIFIPDGLQCTRYNIMWYSLSVTYNRLTTINVTENLYSYIFCFLFTYVLHMQTLFILWESQLKYYLHDVHVL
jgi:hypothetical protein